MSESVSEVLITRPMLAATVEANNFGKIQWPTLASPKIDGIRCLIHPELGPVSRTFKPIANDYIRGILVHECGGSYLDGELYAVNNDGTANFNDTQSAIMSKNGAPNFRYAVFDCFEHPTEPFIERYRRAEQICGSIWGTQIFALAHAIIDNVRMLAAYAEHCLTHGYEGVVIRDQGGPYKSGRSTLNQGWMLKYKPWADAEGLVIGFEELMHNENPQEQDAFGLAKRSSHQEGKVGSGTLGALILQTKWGTLRIGTGFDAATRQEIWERNYNMSLGGPLVPPDLGRVVSFKYQTHGMQDLPRFPVFKGFRED